ncbi:hypothetical protein C2G38_2027580 [Gigaspora rosea]|uniref:Uncharacterized protein n=1 Tax=Gigaspora rosea TaxID=44941 RepID=A0A397W6E8_9GLOM|nr:hypothetical protein C2G38_2027580 [Gigaspora rosea]
MPCQHQYRIFLQSTKAIFHSGLIHTRWFESAPPETLCYITIAQGTKSYTTQGLHFINEIRMSNVYTPSIRKKVNKRIEFGSTMSVAKTSVQIAIEEGVTSELTGLLTQFISKYHRNTGLNMEKVYRPVLHSINNQESSMLANNERQPLSNNVNCNIIEISNPKYHKPRGRPPKRLKSATEEDNNLCKSQSSKTCSYCQEKGHNIRGCVKNKADLAGRENDK